MEIVLIVISREILKKVYWDKPNFNWYLVIKNINMEGVIIRKEMKVTVEIGIFMHEDASGEVKEKEKKLREKLQTYVVGNAGTVIGDLYRVDYKGPMFMEIMKFWEDTHQLNLYVDYFFECKYLNLDRK